MSVSRGVLLALYCDAECLSINVYLYPLSGHSPQGRSADLFAERVASAV